MSTSPTKRKKLLVISTVIVALLVSAGVGYFYYMQNRELSREEIGKKFECHRITADTRQTDVFCGDPTFYNDPENVTKDEYTAYLKCETLLNDSDEAANMRALNRERYEICSNPDQLEQKYVEFKEALLELKNNPNSSGFDDRLSP